MKILKNDQRYFSSAIRPKVGYYCLKENCFKFKKESFVNFVQIWGILYHLKEAEEKYSEEIARLKDFEEEGEFRSPLEITKSNILDELYWIKLNPKRDYRYCKKRLKDLGL